MKKQRLVFLMMCGIGAVCSPINAETDSNNAELSNDAMMSYFPEIFVERTLERYQIPQAQRISIQKELVDKNKEVINLVEDKASKMTPNPLRDPTLRDEAVKIFRDSLYEVFSKVMLSHGVTDKEELHEMLDDIQRQKAEYFSQKMRQYKEENRQQIKNQRPGLSRQPQAKP
jgi:hypothetical protein